MAKAPSPVTELRTTKALLKRAIADCSAITAERNAYRFRANKAEQEVAEWKARFDVLLRRDDLKSNV